MAYRDRRLQPRITEIVRKAGFHSGHQFNDCRDDDGLWITSCVIDNKAYRSRSYQVWHNIKQRCKVGGSFQTKWPHYIGSTMCPEWANDFQLFAEWYTSQAGYALGWEIDKDANDRKHYSSETCVMLPTKINIMLQDRWVTSKSRTIEDKLHYVQEVEDEYIAQGVAQEIFQNLRDRIFSKNKNLDDRPLTEVGTV